MNTWEVVEQKVAVLEAAPDVPQQFLVCQLHQLFHLDCVYLRLDAGIPAPQLMSAPEH